MTHRKSLWMRHEQRCTERRAPLTPRDAARLVGAGISVTVEDSPQRSFRTADYEAAGCSIAPEGSWVDAPPTTPVLGLKELSSSPDFATVPNSIITPGTAWYTERARQDNLDEVLKNVRSILRGGSHNVVT